MGGSHRLEQRTWWRRCRDLYDEILLGKVLIDPFRRKRIIEIISWAELGFREVIDADIDAVECKWDDARLSLYEILCLLSHSLLTQSVGGTIHP